MCRIKLAFWLLLGHAVIYRCKFKNGVLAGATKPGKRCYIYENEDVSLPSSSHD